MFNKVITDPVASEPEGATEPESTESMPEVDEEVLQRRAARPQVQSCRHGLLGVADDCLQHGDMRRALVLLGRVAPKLPKIYREMADIFEAEDPSPDSIRVAARYDRLADRCEKAQRERSRRKCRKYAERRRCGAGVGAWSAAA